MGGDLRAMVSDSPTISADLLPTNCTDMWCTSSMTGPRLVADQNECDCNILFVPMVADGLWRSATIFVVGGQQPVVPSV